MSFAVFYRWEWSKQWLYVPQWQPLTVTKTAAPALSSATFVTHYGTGEWENSAPMVSSGLLKCYNYFYVQIRGLVYGYWTILFTGIIQTENFKLLGRSGASFTADQMLTAKGLDWLLRSRPDGAWVEPVGGGSAIWLKNMPTFNRRHSHGGNITGNRSDFNEEKDSYIFADTGEQWSNWDIIDYLLKHYQINNAPQFKLVNIAEIKTSLENTVGVYDFSRTTIRDALNTLVNRSRGFSWSYAVNADGNVAIIPFSLLDTDIAVGDMTIPANNNKVAINMWDDERAIVGVEQDRVPVYDKIVVRGAKMKSCCTLSFTDSTLEKAWTAAEETAYKDAAKNTTGYSELTEQEKAELNDKFRSTDRFERVFGTLRVPRDWPWQTGGYAESPIVVPCMDSTGVLTTLFRAAYWNVDKRFLSWLPFLAGYDYKTFPATNKNPTDAEPEYRPLFVLIKNSAGKYQYAEKLEPFAAAVRPLARELGVSMKFRPAYMAAKNHWSSAEPGVYTDNITDEGVDYDEIKLTALVETDQPVQLVHNLNNYENKRTLTIEIPDAELWYIVPGTIVDVDDKGDVIAYGGGGGSENLVRDDRDKLRAVLAAAVAWYGREHNKVTITTKAITAGVPIGTMIVNTDVSGIGAAGTVVTSINWNFQELTTTLNTDFGELNIAGIFRE